MFLLGTQYYKDTSMRDLNIVSKYLQKLVPDIKTRKRAINDAVKGLWENSFVYFNGEEIVTSRILTSTSQDIDNSSDKLLKVRVNNDLFDILAKFKNGNFTSISMNEVLKLKNSHRALYIQLKYLSAYKKRSTFYITKEKLQDIFNSDCQNFSTFKQHYVKKAVSEINEKTDIYINVENLTVREKKLLVKQKKKKYPRSNVTEKSYEVRIKITKKIEEEIRIRVMKIKDKIIGLFFKLKENNQKYKIVDLKIDEINNDLFSVDGETDSGNEFTRIIPCKDFFEEFKYLIDKENKINAPVPAPMPAGFFDRKIVN